MCGCTRTCVLLVCYLYEGYVKHEGTIVHVCTHEEYYFIKDSDLRESSIVDNDGGWIVL